MTRRLLLKISGEAFVNIEKSGIEEAALFVLSQKLSELHKLGYEVGVVLGGGNIFRGIHGQKELQIDRTRADQMGMIATLINGLALLSSLQKLNISAKMFSSFACEGMVDRFEWSRVMESLKKDKIVLFVGGTGHPYFTTDTLAALRASEIHADLLLKATMHVDGVYDRDPRLFADAKKYDRISFTEVLEKKLAVMDLSAVLLCMANHIPIRVFNLLATKSITDALSEGGVGTQISGD